MLQWWLSSSNHL